MGRTLQGSRGINTTEYDMVHEGNAFNTKTGEKT